MIDYTELYRNFVKSPKSLLIAPAGYGKTYSIAECLKYSKGKQLILTHTHAGVTSIIDKIKRIKPDCPYSIDTISSFAQKYAEAFCPNEIPDQIDDNYFPIIIQKAINLFNLKPISKIIKVTYAGLFVDEYQDCSISQHNMINALSQVLPTHILGDPMQGIFYFNNEKLIDFENDLKDYKDIFHLVEPWRWKTSSPQLGQALTRIRNILERNQVINLSEFKNIDGLYFLETSEEDIKNKESMYRTWINDITFNKRKKKELNNVLIIIPSSSSIWERVELNKQLSYKYRLLEAFDEKDFYKFAKTIDSLIKGEKIYPSLIKFLKGSIKTRKDKKNKRTNTLLTGLSKYFTNDDKIPKSKKENIILEKIAYEINEFETKRNKIVFLKLLKFIASLEQVNITRKELFMDICKSLEISHYNNILVIDAMKEVRNIKRRVGRRTTGKFIGTTLLTKGLEYDTVVLLNAHKFTCNKNLYVALTRASKKLIIFSNSNIINSN